MIEENSPKPSFSKKACKQYKIVRVSPSWKIQKMVTLGINRKYYIDKYKRFEKRKTRIIAHYDLDQTPKVGTLVWASPCRPLSALKKHIVHG